MPNELKVGLLLNYGGTFYQRRIFEETTDDCELCDAENDIELCKYLNKYCKPSGHFVAFKIKDDSGISGRFESYIKIPLINL